MLGQATQLRYSDPDQLPLRLGTRIFGSGGFTSRLMANVRDKEGLTYGIYSFMSGDTFVDGDWRIQAEFSPALLDKGVASTRRQLDAWYADGITDGELVRAKSEFAGTYQVGLATSGGMAGTILLMLNRGMPLTFVDEYPARVNAITRDAGQRRDQEAPGPGDDDAGEGWDDRWGPVESSDGEVASG